MKKLKYNGIWLMAFIFVIFTTLSLLYWHKHSIDSKWVPESWDGYLASVIFLICSSWFALKAYYQGGRLFWILQIVIAVLALLFDSGLMKEHNFVITLSRYITQAFLWGCALLLCATHGASIFVIKKKQAEIG